MPRTRTQAAEDFARTFVPLEDAAARTAADAYQAVAVAMRVTAAARLAPTQGDDVIALLQRGAEAAAEARRLFAEAHVSVARLGYDLGVPTAFGDDDPDKKAYVTGRAAVRPLRAA